MMVLDGPFYRLRDEKKKGDEGMEFLSLVKSFKILGASWALLAVEEVLDPALFMD